MERSKRLERRTPLAPGKPLARKTPLNRTTKGTPKPTLVVVKSPAGTRRPHAVSGPTATTRRACKARDRGRCVRCGAPAESLQHRTPRGMGGTRDETINDLSNLLSVCGDGTRGCHGWMESYRTTARITGYLVRRGVDPQTAPVLTVDGWQLFGNDGRRIATAPPEGYAP